MERRVRVINMTQQVASVAGIVGFLMCVGTALVLTVRSGSAKRGKESSIVYK